MKKANMNIGEVSGQVAMCGNIHNHGPVTSIQASPGASNIIGDQYQIHIHLTLPSAEIMAAILDILRAGVGSPSPNASSSD